MPEDGDVVDSYEHQVMMIPGVGMLAFLKQRANGDCIYLGRDGCTIHKRAPLICQTFDCRAFYLSKTRAERQALSHGSKNSKAIFFAGRTRLKTLDLS